MSLHRFPLSRHLIAGALLTALALPAMSQPAPDAGPESQLQEREFPAQDGPRELRDGPPRHFFDAHRGPNMPFDAFERLDLSEAQRDQLFTIRHQAEPALRDSHKALRKASQELRALQRVDSLDDNQLKRASDALGSAVATEARLRVKRDQALYQVLTAEQRASLNQRPDREGRGGDKHESGKRNANKP